MRAPPLRGPIRVACLLTLAVAIQVLSGAASRADESTYRTLMDRAVRSLQEAERYFFAGRAPDARHPAARALQLLQEAARLRTREVQPAYLAVQAAVFAGDGAAAGTWMQELARRIGPGGEVSAFHVARGMVLLYLENRPDAAVEALEQAHRLAPRTPDAARDLLTYQALMAAGDHHVRSQDLETALERYRKAVQLTTRMGATRKQRAARGNAGITLQLMERHAEAEAVFENLAHQDPENAMWPFFRGRSLKALGELPEAATAWMRAAELANDRPALAPYGRELREARFEAAAIHLELADAAASVNERANRRLEARRLLERFLATTPGSLRGHYVLGRLLHEVYEEPYAALRHFERAHEIDPICDASLRFLIRIVSRIGPPPGDPEQDPEAAQRAWTARRLAWEKELDANADQWEKARRERQRRSPNGSDGCPGGDR